MPLVQLFDKDPTTRELNTFLDPDGRAFYLTVDDSLERLRVSPAGIPLKYITFCLSLPACAWIWILATRWQNKEFNSLEVGAAIMGFLAFFGFHGLFFLLNKQMISKGDYFVLDKDRKTLTLPRLSTTVRSTEILRFLLLTGWHTDKDRYGSESSWTHELSVITTSAEGINRLPVVIHDNGKKMRLVAKLLGGYLQVDVTTTRSGIVF